MSTERSFGNMLNDNLYSRLLKDEDDKKKTIAERESIRNQLIDQTGQKPSETEIDYLLSFKRKVPTDRLT